MRPNLSKTLGVFFGVISVLLLITVFLIPKLLFSLYKIDSINKSLIDINNYNLWAYFPGKLDTKIQHEFKFYNLVSFVKDETEFTTYNYTLLNDSLIFDENITYSNFSFTDKTNEVTFMANSMFKINSTISPKDPKVNTFSLGMMELIHTISDPPNYQIMMNALNIITNNILDPKKFIKKLFTIFAHKKIMANKEMVKKTILSKFSYEVAEFIYEGDDKYSIGHIKGFYQWALMIDEEDRKHKALWPKDNLKLSTNDVDHLIGSNSFIYRFYQYFINNLKYTFKCYDDENCINQLVYKQLLDGSVTKSLNIENIAELYKDVDSDLYPFIFTPEISEFFNGEFKKKMREMNNTRYENMTFEQLDIDLDIIKSLVIGNTTSLLKTENAIDFLFFNYTKNLYSAYLKFNIQTLDQLSFFCEYFANFLPYAYLYPAFKANNKKVEEQFYGNKLSNAIVSLIPIVVNNSIEKIKNNIQSVLIARIAFHKLQSEENIIDCQDIFLSVTKNNKTRVDEICSNDLINLENYKSIKKWVYISDCIYSFCKEDEKNEMIKISGLSEIELAEFFLLKNFGKYINIATEIMRNYYQISNNLIEKASNQFFFSEITLNVPQFMLEIKSRSLSDFDKEVFPNSLEIPYYFNCLDCRSIREDIIKIFHKEIKSNIVIFNEEEIFAKRVNLTISLTKSFIFPKVKNPDTNYIQLVKKSLFYKIDQNYSKLDIILGGADNYLEILNKGNFYESFKPAKKRFNGLPIKLGFENTNFTNENEKLRRLIELKESKEVKANKSRKEGQFDESNIYTMYTGRFSVNNANIRSISKMNFDKIFNYKKQVYTNEGKSMFYGVPIYKGKNLIESSDGFQYSTEKNFIYYYDKFSSNVLSFEFKKINKFNNINCDYYELSNKIETPLTDSELSNSTVVKNSKNTLGNAFEKFDRPVIVARTDNIIKSFENTSFSKIYVKYQSTTANDLLKPNYICIDQFSQFVVSSNFQLTYALLLKSYNNFNDIFSKDVLVPLFDYSRSMSITEESYKSVFPDNISYQSQSYTIKIFGLILIVVCIVLSVIFVVRYKNEAKLELNSHDNGILLN